MENKTEYIAPFSLWLVVRKRFSARGLFVEPAWVGADGESGPAMFVSRILAEVYAHLRNKHYGGDDSDNWKVIPLHDFDLLEYARGIDGPLYCMLAFGFAMEDAKTVICINCPCLRMITSPYNLPEDAKATTFLFNQAMFDFMREEWASIGLPHFEKELEATDELDASSFDRWLQTAIASLKVCRSPAADNDGPWAVFSVQRGMWVADRAVLPDRSIH